MGQDGNTTISDNQSMDINNAAAIYLRRSSSQGLDNSTSIERQRKFCTEAAERLNLVVVKEYNEGEGFSVSHLHSVDRPQWDAAMEGAGSVYGTLILEKVDRADRKGAAAVGKLLDHAEASGVRVVTCNGQDSSTEAGRLMMVIEGEQARAEIVKAGERIREAKSQGVAAGKYLGGIPPFGQRLIRYVDKPSEVELVEEECQFLREMVSLYLDGASYRDLANLAREKGFKGRRGGFVGIDWVQRALTNPMLVGFRRYYPKDNPHKHGDNYLLYSDEFGTPIQVTEPVISVKAFYELQAEIKSRQIGGAKPGAQSLQMTRRKNQMLGGLLICTGCNDTLQKHTRQGAKRKDGTEGPKVHRYRCTNCDPTYRFSSEAMNDFVAIRAINFIRTLEPDSKLFELIGERLIIRFNKGDQTERERLEGELMGAEARKKTLLDDYYNKGKMSQDEFDWLLSNMDGKISLAKEQLSDLPPLKPDYSIIHDLTAAGDNDGNPIGEGSVWDQLSDGVKRSLMLVLIDRVSIDPPQKTSTTRSTPDEVLNFEDRIHIEFASEDNVIELASRKSDTFTVKNSSRIYKAG